MLVAPPQASFDGGFNNVSNDSAENSELIHEMQTLRGSIYLEEGNVKRRELTADGRHVTAEDDKSWHLLMTDEDGHVRSCALYILHENATSIQDLRLRHCPLVKRAESRAQVKFAVESEIDGRPARGPAICRARRLGDQQRASRVAGRADDGPGHLRSVENAWRRTGDHDRQRRALLLVDSSSPWRRLPRIRGRTDPVVFRSQLQHGNRPAPVRLPVPESEIRRAHRHGHGQARQRLGGRQLARHDGRPVRRLADAFVQPVCAA